EERRDRPHAIGRLELGQRFGDVAQVVLGLAFGVELARFFGRLLGAGGHDRQGERARENGWYQPGHGHPLVPQRYHGWLASQCPYENKSVGGFGSTAKHAMHAKFIFWVGSCGAGSSRVALAPS